MASGARRQYAGMQIACRANLNFPTWDFAAQAGKSSSRRTVFDCRTASACPFAEGNVREPVGVALAFVNVSEDYQRQRLLDIVVAVHPLRDGLGDPVERSAHDGDGLGTVGAISLN